MHRRVGPPPPLASTTAVRLGHGQALPEVLRRRHVVITLRASEHPSARSSFAGWIPLPSTPGAPGLARRFLATALSAEDQEVADVAALLTSELVTNAVLHGQGPVRLQVRRGAATLRVEVSDGSTPFALRPPSEGDALDGDGLGLLLLNALATSWGSQYAGPTTAGKTLWFELARSQIDLTATRVEDAATASPPW